MKKILLSILVITALSSIGNTQQTSEEVTKKNRYWRYGKI
tara:strand:+ start:604 stop:723 length:120 start_codon:yes stop_codon:yes gene_type:complete